MSDRTYKLTVTYAAGNKDEHGRLSAMEAEAAIGAFSRDLFFLKGSGVTQLTLEIEDE